MKDKHNTICTFCAVIIISFAFFNFTSCENNKNSKQNQSEDNNSAAQPLYPKKPSSVSFYIETSAGMKGYFPKADSTKFKTSCYAIMQDFSGKIFYLNSTGEKTKELDISKFDVTDFSKENFNGRTHLIKMLNTIVDNDTITDGVSIFVSDLRYDPKESGKKESIEDKLSVYYKDLEKIFDTCQKRGRAVSLICATSNFIDGKKETDKSPYYYLVIGKPSQVVYTRNLIIKELDDAYVTYLEAGMDYKSLSNAFESPKSKDNCQKRSDSEFHINKGKEECIVTYVVNDATTIFPCLRKCTKDELCNFWNVKGYQLITCDINSYELDNSSLIIKVNVDASTMATETAKISWKLNADAIPFDMAALEHFYTNDYNDGSEDIEKSYSIEQFIKAMKEYPNKVGSSEHKIKITKSK